MGKRKGKVTVAGESNVPKNAKERVKFKDFFVAKGPSPKLFARVAIVSSIFMSLLLIMYTFTGGISLAYCKYHYYTNTGIISAVSTFLTMGFNIVLLCLTKLANVGACVVFIIVNVLNLALASVNAVASGVVGTMCEIKGMGNKTFAGIHKEKDICKSGYSNMERASFCDDEADTFTKDDDTVIYYMFYRYTYIGMNCTLAIVGFLGLFVHGYLIFFGAKAYGWVKNMTPKSPIYHPESKLKSSMKKNRSPKDGELDKTPPVDDAPVAAPEPEAPAIELGEEPVEE